MKSKREAKIVVISDVHLGSFGSHAKQLARYLKSIEPEILVLNGDIIDGWAFSKRYWPASHAKVLQRILRLVSKGTLVYYLTGNHDEILRRYSKNRFGNFYLLDKLLLSVDGKRYWFFHGDVFDISIKNAKWLAKLGSKGYDLLIILNRFINYILVATGRERVSFSKRIKNKVKQAVKFINDFEMTAAELAIEQHIDYVVCGHIHQPVIKEIENKKGKVIYMNSGDWIENLTALEYANEVWSIYHYPVEEPEPPEEESENELLNQNVNEDFIRHSMYG